MLKIENNNLIKKMLNKPSRKVKGAMLALLIKYICQEAGQKLIILIFKLFKKYKKLKKETKISDLIIIEPTVFGDARGYFLESYNQKKFEEVVGKTSFVQDNESKSSKGVLRGLHFQKPPFEQAKLVRCIEGEVLDVAVDIRKNSKTYGKHVAVLLSGENKRQLFVPRGFAHGFLVLSDSATFAYKVDNTYAPDHDAGIRWNDKELNIQWGMEDSEVMISEKDAELPFFSEFESPFTN